MNLTRVATMTAVVLIGIVLWMPSLRSRRVSAQSPSLSGAYGFSITVPYTGNAKDTAVLQGSVIFDGAGNVTSSGGVIVGIDPDQNATVPQVQPLQSNPGTYTVNPDGTGMITIQNPKNGNTTALSFVITDGGSQLMLVVTSGVGNAVGTGIARKQ